MAKITFLENIFKPTQVKSITLNQALSRIINGESRSKVEQYRKTRDEKIKKSLPAVMFNGEFTTASNKDLVVGSGCAILDFDNVDNLEKLQDRLAGIDYIICSWISVGGSGIKALARIPVVHSNKEYRVIAGALLNDLKELGVEDIDELLDVRRLCFESYSENGEFRAYRKFVDAEIFSKQIKQEHRSVHLQADKEERISADEKRYRGACIMMANDRDLFKEGNRNKFIYKLAAICCNYGAREGAIKEFILEDYGDAITNKEIIATVSSAFNAEKYTKWEFPYIRVGGNYFKVKQYELLSWRRQDIVDDYGAPTVRKIPHYDAMTLEPDNTDSWQAVIGSKYNLYTPFVHAVKKGSFKTIEQLMRHIFGEQLEMGYDYLRLLYLKPKQVLPVLCIVSKENQTGKSTFLEFLEAMFMNNTTIMSVEEYESRFNGGYGHKLLLCLDESETSDKKKVTNKIKQMSTQKMINIEYKHQNIIRVPYYGKIVMASNQEHNFVHANREDVRYWVRKIGLVNIHEDDFEKRLVDEIPAFCHFLRTRPMQCNRSKSRMWFSFDDIWTSALGDVVAYNRHPVIVELEEWLENIFTRYDDVNEVCLSAKTIKDRVLINFKGRMPSSKYLNDMIRGEWKIEMESGRHDSVIGGGVTPSVVHELGSYFTFYRQLLESQGSNCKKK